MSKRKASHLRKKSDFLSIKKQIILICERLYLKDMLAGADGNVSCRVSPSNILLTPSGVHKAFMLPEDISLIDENGSLKEGQRQPSSEFRMHLSVYQHSANARFVIHAHPPFAISWTIAHPDQLELPSDVLPETILALGTIPIVSYAMPGTKKLANQISSFLPKNRALILSRHGALSWGETIEEAYNGMERIEHVAKILFHAELLQELSFLPEEEVRLLREKRKKLEPFIF